MKKSLFLLLLLAAAPLLAGPVITEPVRGKHAVVASVSEIASRVGTDVMKKGGNAVDATVAVAFVLQVVWPEAGNIGGGGFLLLRTPNGKSQVLDYRERAPLAATREMYLDAKGNVIPKLSSVGAKGAGVPGTVAGLRLAHKKWGKLKWAELVEPARKLAAEGFVVSEFLSGRMNEADILAKLAKFDDSKRIYLPNGKALAAGSTFVQPELAATLARIQKDPSDFYKGTTAKLIVEEMKRGGGLVTLKDLAEYQPTIRKPLTGTYRGYEIVTMPPPSSGGVTLIEMLNMLEPRKLASHGHNTSEALHLLLEVERRAYADRAKWLGDTDFAKGVPIQELAGKRYAQTRMRSFDPEHASPSSRTPAGNPLPYESPQTTHFTIVDPAGMVVTNTFTLNDSFGSGETVTGAGFLLNDEMDDFTSKPGVPNGYGLIQSEANAIAPRKRPLSSMTPTIVLKDGKLFMALGSPGGGTIINTVLQVLVNVIDYGMGLQQAVNVPRFHHQWLPDEVYWEEGTPADLRASLEAMGYHFRAKAEELGDAEAIMIDAKTGDRLAASDWRRGGAAAGY